MEERQLYALALAAAPGLGLIGKHKLVEEWGSPAGLFLNRKELARPSAHLPRKFVEALGEARLLARAEEELAFAEKNRIRCLTFDDEDYPARLRECVDAPLALFYRGNVSLNKSRVINMVGTRRATAYGQGICRRFLADLACLCPDVLVVSGLAYGIDIHAHRAALQNRFDTVGVLAHGLDRLYPAQHRRTAIEMLEQGGLLTEFGSGTNPDRQNFVRRNRIVAGMSDATIVVESASKGGALITAELAEGYHRDCFAFPGRVDDEFSAGCNDLIKTNRAMLITSAEDLVSAMRWDDGCPKAKAAVQRELFPELDEDGQRIVGLLKEAPDGMQINVLAVAAGIPVHRISALLFELEMKGVVRALAGGVYRLAG